MIVTSRRNFLIGFGSLIAAPAIVHIENIMPVRASVIIKNPPFVFTGWDEEIVRRVCEMYGLKPPIIDEIILPHMKGLSRGVTIR